MDFAGLEHVLANKASALTITPLPLGHQKQPTSHQRKVFPSVR